MWLTCAAGMACISLTTAGSSGPSTSSASRCSSRPARWRQAQFARSTLTLIGVMPCPTHTGGCDPRAQAARGGRTSGPTGGGDELGLRHDGLDQRRSRTVIEPIRRVGRSETPVWRAQQRVSLVLAPKISLTLVSSKSVQRVGNQRRDGQHLDLYDLLVRRQWGCWSGRRGRCVSSSGVVAGRWDAASPSPTPRWRRVPQQDLGCTAVVRRCRSCRVRMHRRPSTSPITSFASATLWVPWAAACR